LAEKSFVPTKVGIEIKKNVEGGCASGSTINCSFRVKDYAGFIMKDFSSKQRLSNKKGRQQ